MCFLLCHTESSLSSKKTIFFSPPQFFNCLLIQSYWETSIGHAAAASEAVVTGHYTTSLPKSTTPRLQISYPDLALISPYCQIIPIRINKHIKTLQNNNIGFLILEVEEIVKMQVKRSNISM